MNDLKAKQNKTKLPLTSICHSHTSGTLFVFLVTEGFREIIGLHLNCRNILDSNNFVWNGFANEMMTDIDVFSMSVGYGILCESNGALIVGEEIGRFVVRIIVTV